MLRVRLELIVAAVTAVSRAPTERSYLRCGLTLSRGYGTMKIIASCRKILTPPFCSVMEDCLFHPRGGLASAARQPALNGVASRDELRVCDFAGLRPLV